MKAATQRTYQLCEAAEAADIPPHKLRRLIDQCVIPLRGNDVKPGGSGYYIGLSRPRVLQAAVTQHLTSVGVTVSKAAEAAYLFSDVNSGELAPVGRNLLIIAPGVRPAVMNSELDASLASLLASGASVVLVDLDKIVAQVDSTLSNFKK